MKDSPNQMPRELRRAPGRWVELDPSRGVVTKFFRGRSRFARLRDRGRARREAELLRLLRTKGVAAPEVRCVRREKDGTWSVEIEEVRGALTAEDALTQSRNRGQLLESLARLLAAVQAVGIDQPDLHGKNALVDGDGQPWAIDFHAARACGPLGLGPRLLERDLVTLASSFRETTTTEERSRFFAAWRAALPEHMARALDEPGALGRRIESRARAKRLAVCAAYARPSSRYFRVGGSFAAAEGDEGGAQWLIRRGASGPLAEAALASREVPGLLFVRGTQREVEAAWGRVARIAAHGLPGPRPLVLDRREPPCAWFDLNTDQTPTELSLPPSDSARAALDAALRDRGLALANDLPAAFLMSEGTLLLAPLAELRALDLRADQSRAQRRARRRMRRERLARTWPYLTALPLRPLTSAALNLVARAARLTSIERRLAKNLSTGLPTEAPRKLTPHIRRHMARLAIEWGRLGSDPQWLKGRVQFDESVSRLDEALATGRGVIVITPHLGNWELLAAAIVARGVTGAVIGRRRLRDPSAHVLEDLRRRAGVETLPQDCSPRELLRRLARGEVLGILPDVEVQRLAGVRMPFLGKDALVMSAPAALARAARLPLLPVRCVMDESSGAPRGPYRIEFAEPIEAPHEREETDLVTAKWVALFETWIQESPRQWLWIHDRWRTPPSPADKVPLAALRKVQADSHRKRS